MNETKNYSILEILLVLFVVFGLFIYYVFFRSSNSENIGNTMNINNDYQNSTSTLDENTISKNKNDLSIYEMYLTKKKEMQGQGDEEVVNSVKADLDARITIPEQATPTLKVGNFDKKIYSQKFEKIYQDQKKAGMTSESKTFALQFENDNLFIPLSDFDRENFLRTANLYAEFADKIQSLDTPIYFKLKSEETVKSARNIAYILKTLRTEKDPTIYKLWVVQYIEALNAIIFSRYAGN